MNVISIIRGKIKDREHNKDKKEPQCGSWRKVVKNKKLHRNRTYFNADIVQGSPLWKPRGCRAIKTGSNNPSKN